MRTLPLFGFILLTALAPVAAGCAADASDDAAESEDAILGGDRQRAEGLLAEAERLAAAHADGAYCETEATTDVVLSKLYEATGVNKTASFRKKIAQSTMIRAAVGQTVEFAKLTGAISVKNNRVLGLAKATLTGRIEVYGPAPGAYGNMSKLELRAGGKGTLSKLEFDDAGVPTWSSNEISYVVRELSSGTIVVLDTPSGEKTLNVRHVAAADGQIERFVLDGPAEDWLKFDSLPSECEA